MLRKLLIAVMRPETMLPLALSAVGLGLTYLTGLSKQLADSTALYQKDLGETLAQLDAAREDLGAVLAAVPADPHSGVRVDYDEMAKA